VVQQLVALGAVKGEVLDPGTGPGHHAIYYASKGSTTHQKGCRPPESMRRPQRSSGRGRTHRGPGCR
jgi:hypothetical protein